MKMIAKLCFFLAAWGVLLGCPPTPPPGKPTPNAGICLAEDPGIVAGSCGQKRTTEGWLCALCAADRACMDTQTFTWCVGDLGCDDPACGSDKFKRAKRK